MRLRFLVLCLVAALAPALWADEAPPAPTPQYFGLGAGATTGVGLAYRWWDGPLGVQVNVGPFWDPYFGFYSAGVTGLVLLHDVKWSRFFGYGGAAVHVTDSRWGGTSGAQITGGGLGIEFVAFDHLAIDVQAGLAAYLNLNARRFENLGITGEVGVYYRL